MDVNIIHNLKFKLTGNVKFAFASHSKDKNIMKKIGLILSGGSARGAYEIGVLKALLPELKKREARFVICGTSVGSINSCVLASLLHLDAEEIIEGLEHYWLTLKKEHVFVENWATAGLKSFLGSLKLGQPDFQGFLDSTPLKDILESEMNWEQIKKNIESGLVQGLTVSVTSIQSGKSVVFYQSTNPNLITVIPRSSQVRFVPDVISAKHLIASCAIPIFFKPEYLKFGSHGEEFGDWFFDGGVRQNTPLLPGIILGAEALVIMGLHYMDEVITSSNGDKPGLIPNIGNLLNAIFLDHIRHDAERLHMVNEILDAIDDTKIIGRLNENREKQGMKKLKYIPDLFISPSKKISEIAEEIWDKYPSTRKNFKTLDWLFRLGNIKGHLRGDLLSYFFFNPIYSKELIDLGYKDGLEKINTEVWDSKKKKNVRLIDKLFD